MVSTFRPDSSLSGWRKTVDVQDIMPGAQVTVTVEREVARPAYKVRVQARYGTEDLVSYSVMWAGLDRDQQESFIEDRARTALKHLAGVVTGKWDESLRPVRVSPDSEELAAMKGVLELRQLGTIDTGTAIALLEANAGLAKPGIVLPAPPAPPPPPTQSLPTPPSYHGGPYSPWTPGQAAILAMGTKTVGRSRLWAAQYEVEEVPSAAPEHTRFVEKVKERLS